MNDDFFEAPPEIEAFVLAAFDDFQRRRKRRMWAGCCLVAAALAGVAVLIRGSGGPVPSKWPSEEARVYESVPAPAVSAVRVPPARKRRRRRAAVAPIQSETDFIPIPYTLPIAPGERVSVIRREMPVSELVAAGVPMFGTDTGARAQAELVLGEDGVARAVRVIAVAEYRENR